jgi:hypothetical protein
MGRLLFNHSRSILLTAKHLNNAIIDNQQLNLVLSMVRNINDQIAHFVNVYF